jgi:hypothetical protein
MSSELGFSKQATGLLERFPDKKIIPPCKYLRKKGTDEIFCYTIYLAERKDMEPYEGPLPNPNGNQTISEMLANLNTFTGVNHSEELVNLTKPNFQSDPEYTKKIAKIEIEKTIIALRNDGKSLSFIGKTLGISKVAVHKRLKRIAMRQLEYSKNS